MNLPKKYIKRFNSTDSLIVVTSFPERKREMAIDNAVARYSYLLLSNFPSNKRVIVLCEKRSNSDKPYTIGENILVVPTYKVNSLLLFAQLNKAIATFSEVKSVLIQFEFSIFGGKHVTGLFPLFLASLKVMGKEVSISMHQVVSNLGSLSGHLGLKDKSVRLSLYNQFLKYFYKSTGIFADKIIVHDQVLKNRLMAFVEDKKIAVVPHGVGTGKALSKEQSVAIKNKLGIKENEFVILAFGYQSWYKGTDWIVANVGEIAKKHKNLKIRLLLAGDKSPTLKDSSAYKKFTKKFELLKEKYAKQTISTGFVPEKEVGEIIGVSDVLVFPYRTRMSASGALSLCMQYKKPFLVSRPFSSVFLEEDILEKSANNGLDTARITFALQGASLENKLTKFITDTKLQKQVTLVSKQIGLERSWASVSLLYLDSIASINTRPVYALTISQQQV